MGRKPKPVPTAGEIEQMRELWRKVLPLIEKALDSPQPSPLPEDAPAEGAPAPI